MTQPENFRSFIDDARARLDATNNPPAWQERRDIAANLARALAAAAADASALKLVFQLSDDPKPEVRKEIAEALIHLPADVFTRLAAKLSADDNAFVKQAAERSVARRRRASVIQKTAYQKLGEADERLAKFEATYGVAAAKAARRVTEDLFSSLIRQTHHNIPNILSPVKTNLSLMSRQLEQDQPNIATCREYLAEMAQQIEYLELFFKDLREYTSAKSGAPRERESVNGMVVEANAMAMATLGKYGIDVSRVATTIGVSESLTVCVARYKVVMALTHLIRNAYEALAGDSRPRRKRKLSIKGRNIPGDLVELVIADNGPGVSEKNLRILRTFVPLERSRKSHGTGFGVATAAAYIGSQGGSLSLDSAQGQGFSAVLQLPVECEDEDA